VRLTAQAISSRRRFTLTLSRPTVHCPPMTQQDIIQKIEAYEARDQELRRQLIEASSDRERAELQLMLRIKTVVCSGSRDNWKEPSALAPLDDPLAQLLTLKVELRRMEGARDDALKAAAFALKLPTSKPSAGF
jgi:hypothetical protein